MRVHACLMTQNELPDLVANIEHLLPHVDSVNIVDGGSIDGTIIYFRNWAREEPKIRFFIHPWQDNFPAQRNNYLRRVGEIAQQGDWILAIDPDEFLDDNTLASLRDIARVVPAKAERFTCVELWCRSVSYRGAKRVWQNDDDYRKQLFYRWAPTIQYGHNGPTPVHETLRGAGPVYTTGHHPEFPKLRYEHRKQEDVIWPRGVRNYFMSGGGPNLGAHNPRWVELKGIASRLGIQAWPQMQAYLLKGNICQELRAWIIKYRHERGWDGSSEQREWFKAYFRLWHPEEEPAELRGEVIE